MEFQLSQPSDGVGDWRLTHDPKGSFAAMSWHTRHATIGEFDDRHSYLSTSPESGFVQTVCAQRRDGTSLTALRALTLTTIATDTKEVTAVEDRTEWFAALSDIFDIRLDNATGAARDRLWRSANESHDRHRAASAASRPVDDKR
jgi:arylamine N-acetyltransferase